MGESTHYDGVQFDENGVINKNYEEYIHRENELTQQNIKRGIWPEHEAYKKFLTKSGKTMPDISGLSYRDLTPPVKEFINQTYKEYLAQKYRQEYENAQRKTPREPQSYVSYQEYLFQSGRKYIPVYQSGENLSEPDREYITQTYKEYLVWKDEKREYRKNLISRLDSNPLLSQEGRERILKDDERSRQMSNANWLERHLREGDTPPPTIEDGIIMTGTESFILMGLKIKQMKAEAKARGEEYKQPQLSLRPIDLAPLTPERRLQRDQEIVQEEHYKLAKEARETQFDEIAEVIKTKMWKNAPSGHGITIKPYLQIDMGVKADGSVINRSKAGTTIGNAHDALSFGIGYFTDRAAIIDEAQGLLSDEELQKGIKANFIQHTYTVEEEGKTVEKTEMIVIPHAYAEHVRLFCAFLRNAVIIISPDEYTTQIRKALQLETRKAPILRRVSAIAA